MIFYTNPGLLTAFEGILQTRSSIRTRARFRRPAMHGHCLATTYSITIMRLSLPSGGAELLAERGVTAR